MPRGIKRNALELAAQIAAAELTKARKRYQKARDELDEATAAAAVADERVRFQETLAGVMS